MFQKRFLILSSTLLPLLAAVALLTALRPPAVMAAPDTTITVDTLLDENDGSCADGDCSLRDAIATANPGDDIEFNVAGTIILAGELVVDQNIAINGGGAITVSGNNASRVFKVTSNWVMFDGLTIADGDDQSTDCFAASCAGAIMIMNPGTIAYIMNSTIINNAGKYGGAVHNSWNSTMTIDNSTFVDNVGDFGGGLLNKGTLTVNRSTFISNTATWDGGGLMNTDGATTTINNSTFSHNSADSGGGISNYDHDVIINHSTITQNHADEEGGGVGNFGDSATHTMIAFTIIASNTVGAGVPDDVALLVNTTDGFMSGGYNLIGAVGANITAFVDGVNGDQIGLNDPKLSPLANNGGSTLTHALLPDSPAVDMGHPDYPVQAGDYDQRGDGFDRVINGRLDIGSYELATCTTPIIVTSTLSSGAGTLRQAITDVCHGGLITFDALLTDQIIDISPDGELVISKSLTISGSVPITVSGGNATRIFNVTDGNVAFDGLTIANGNDQGIDCTFGPSYSCGGGVLIQSGNVIVNNSTLISNTAQLGGGIFSYDTVTVSDSAFISNSAEYGGAITSEGAAVISHSTIAGNTALGGGGIVNNGISMIINSTVVTGNIATNDDGGGVANIGGGTLTVTNGSFTGNTAVTQGGGILNRNGTVIVNGSTFSDNLTGSGGSGFYNFDMATVGNSTFSENLSGTATGSGLFNDNGTLTVRNSTFSGNGAITSIPTMGSGIFNLAGTLHLYNSILANTLDGTDCYSDNGVVTDVNNVIEVNNGCGVPVSTADPNLGPLADNGGSTLTHALLSGSPAIDAGDPAYPVLNGDYDQRGEGFMRVINGRLDIGSYELEQTCTTPIIVTSTLSSGTGTLRQAITDVCHGGLITFDASLSGGTIDISTGSPITGQLTISKSLTISGNVPITVSGGNVVRAFNIMTSTPPTIDVVFDRLTIANGHGQPSGGGIMIQSNGIVFTLTNSALISNTARDGGGIYNQGTMTIMNSTFFSNGAIHDGGGIYNRFHGRATVISSTLSGNVANDGGGGIFSQGVMAVSNSIFSTNVADIGGGIYTESYFSHDTVRINNSVISGNSASNGGGIFVGYSSNNMVTIDNSIISNNSATFTGGVSFEGNGGGIASIEGTVVISDSVLFNNSADNGGGIFNGSGGGNAGVMTVNNSSISDNFAATSGGGIFNNRKTAIINNSTLSGNSTDTPAGGGNIHNDSGAFHLSNTILANAPSGGDCYSTNAPLTDINNLIEINDGCGTPVSTADPLLSTLQDNGGSTLTHALLSGSPAIDAGDPAYPIQAGDYDQRGEGFDRVVNGRLDIGSYELVNCTTPIIVTSTLSSGAGTLRQAITDVCHGGLITFDAPLTDQTIDISPDGELVISKILTISSSVPITVSGNNAVRVFNVMTGTMPAVDVTFDGLVIANGNVQTTDCGSHSALCGGGIIIQNSGVALTITNSSLISNTSEDVGGGVANFGGDLTIKNSTIVDNSTDYPGGGIFNEEGMLTIISSTISHNSANSGGGIANWWGGIVTITNSNVSSNFAGGDGGGGIESEGMITINNSTISNNRASFGGGMYITDSYEDAEILPTINNTIFSNNTAFDGIGGGIYSGIYKELSVLKINNVTLSENSAYSETSAYLYGGGLYNYGNVLIMNSAIISNSSGLGGGILHHYRTMTVTNSTLSGNSASSYGGGIFNSQDTLTIDNSTLSGNSANAGGGITNWNGVLTVTNSTLSSNSVISDGGGVYNRLTLNLNHSTIVNNTSDNDSDGIGDGGGIYNDQDINSATITFKNNLVAGNHDNSTPANDDCAVNGGGTQNSLGYNIVGNNDGCGIVAGAGDMFGTAVNPINPNLAPLSDNGGSTLTHALLPGSPAIDAGDPVSCLSTDQRGIARVGICDIGAFESRGFTLALSGGTPQTMTVNTPFTIPLALTISSPFGEPVEGGMVTFSAPSSGAGVMFTETAVFITASPIITLPVTANDTVGSYQLFATASGNLGNPIPYALTNIPVVYTIFLPVVVK